jgi:hypothetical protein
MKGKNCGKTVHFCHQDHLLDIESWNQKLYLINLSSGEDQDML